ncbi:MAG: tetratricopeptide repeat protein [Chitinophagaceae bacterium]
MKNVWLFFVLIGFCASAQTGEENYQQAKKLMQQGDFDKAAVAFTSAIKQLPNNNDIAKDYVYLLCLQKDYVQAIAIGKRIVEQPDADEQAYQVLGIAYKGKGEYANAEDLYLKALKKFTNSGLLYNEYGELMALWNNLPNAIVKWEAGIEADPNYSSNYYNAAMYYNRFDLKPLWQILYAEIFINLESYSQRTSEMKAVLLDAYKKLFTNNLLEKSIGMPKNTAFEKACYSTMAKHSNVVSNNVSVDAIIALKTRFLLDWFFSKQNEVFAYRMFEQQQYLIREGMFVAYNQWMLGAANSPAAYQVWLNTHEQEATAFKQFQQGRVLKLLKGQYYQ